MRILSFAPFAEPGAEGFDLAKVTLADLARASHDLGNLLQAFELDQAIERELQLVRVHDVEDDDLAAAEADVLNAVEDFLFIVEEVADQDRNALALDRAGQRVKDLCD